MSAYATLENNYFLFILNSNYLILIKFYDVV